MKYLEIDMSSSEHEAAGIDKEYEENGPTILRLQDTSSEKAICFER